MIQLVLTIIFIASLVTFIVFSVVIVYHLLRFSFRKEKAKELALIYVAVSVILIIFAVIAFFQISWKGLNNLG